MHVLPEIIFFHGTMSVIKLLSGFDPAGVNMQAKYLRMVHALNIVNSGLNVPQWLSGLDAYRNSELLQQDLATER